jgi:uncharacterized membrane protein YidH (DUF202 family)
MVVERIRTQLKETSDALLGLAREENRLTAGLLSLAERRNEMADSRTADAKTRTALAKDRTSLSEQQAEESRLRTELARERTGLSGSRTDLARDRTGLAERRTDLSAYRSVMASGRTQLALIRTGLALIALGTGMMRYFGLGGWTILDGALILVGITATILGFRSFLKTRRFERAFARRLHDAIAGASGLEQH